MDKELTFNTGYTNPVDEELLEQLRENFEKQVGDYLEFVEDHISKTMGEHIFIDEYSVGDEKPAEPVYDISWIRKRMKHCTNPMERKQLEKQLNAAFKAKKKARRKK